MSSLPPHKAGVGSAVNDLARELGGAFGIGILGSLTIDRYRSHLTPALAQSHQAPQIATQAKAGLAQALKTLGGPHTAPGLAARNAYTSGLDLAMIVGAALVAAAAIVVHLALKTSASAPSPASAPVRPQPVIPDRSESSQA
jgi:hypothetical protein